MTIDRLLPMLYIIGDDCLSLIVQHRSHVLKYREEVIKRYRR